MKKWYCDSGDNTVLETKLHEDKFIASLILRDSCEEEDNYGIYTQIVNLTKLNLEELIEELQDIHSKMK